MSIELDKTSDAAVIRDLAAGLSEVSTAGEGAKPFVVVPEGYHVHDLHETLPAPLHITASPSFKTLASLIAYVEGFKLNTTTIFANPDDGQIRAVIDYHGANFSNGKSGENIPAWCRHTANHKPDLSVEWSRWNNSNDKWMEQRAFAEFIENNVDDITEPQGAKMLEIATTLEAKTAVEFKSGVRLDNGSTRLTFNSETTARAGGNSDIDIPLVIKLAIAPFKSGEAYPVMARFKYKIDGGKLALKYQLVNPHKVIEAAVSRMIELITTGTNITPFLGLP